MANCSQCEMQNKCDGPVGLVRQCPGEAEPSSNGYEFQEKEVNKTITIEIYGGCLTDVRNLPKGWNYELIDHDNLEAEEEDQE